MGGHVNERLWKTKVLSWIHDPAEKALILLRGKSHEKGTAEKLRRLLFGDDAASLPASLNDLIRKADRWASAADRPSLPKNLGTQVVFAKDPQLVHPLTGEAIRLPDLTDDPQARVEAVEAVSFDHFRTLVVRSDGQVDWRRTFLAFWRFGPESPAQDLGALWKLLPADTRSPDHSIWEHLSLTSAFAGCLAADPKGPSLFLMSFGPVQGFIAQARSVSDLWAGSHLLSRIAWEAMKIVCEQYGPDAILFPYLLGVPFVDAWIHEQLGDWPRAVPVPWKSREGDWLADDRNPLFAAALPNRFVALVPAGEAASLANRIQTRVRSWVVEQACDALEILWEKAGPGEDPAGRAQVRRQIETQFSGFPEVHWAVVPWDLTGTDTLNDSRLKRALATLGGAEDYMDPALYGVVTREIRVQGAEFFVPNPGVGYPGLYEVLERLHAAAKSARPFEQADQKGWRCTLCGEREWLAQSSEVLWVPKGERAGTLWQRVSERSPSLAREDEFLCGLCALKRVWPELFKREVEAVLERAGAATPQVRRYNLSTRSVALATTVEHWLEHRDAWEAAHPEKACKAKQAENELRRLVAKDLPRASIPYRLLGMIHRRREEHPDRWPDVDFFKALPALQDAAKSAGTEERWAAEVTGRISTFLWSRPETYYALVLMDGDRMGAWLSGETGTIPLEQRFHGKIRNALKAIPELKAYLEAPRPGSPARHQAISAALNSFALGLARYIVEHLFMGKLIYAGGDDLLAMVAVHDLPGLMWALRCAYSGVLPAGRDAQAFWKKACGDPGVRLRLANGFAGLAWREEGGEDGAHVRHQVFRLMGANATASIGAVVVHHQAPLSRVLRDLRKAEKRAKEQGGRDAFCITVDKRAGGTTHWVGKWRLDAEDGSGHMELLLDLRDLFASHVSHRAAYALCERLRDVPKDAFAGTLAYQFARQSGGRDHSDLAERLARAATNLPDKLSPSIPGWPGANAWLRDLIVTAEFLAREGRAGGGEGK